MQQRKSGGTITDQSIRVWDLPIRLFHWALVVLMAVSYFTGRAGGDWMKFHFWSGYTILTLLLFRLCWGFAGSTTARFSDFIKGPTAGLRHVGELIGGGKPREAGHNPLGGLMVLVLLAAVLLQVVAGLFSADTDMGMVSGPLANRVADKWVDRATAVHHYTVDILLILVGLHVLAVIVYLILKRQNLVRAMVTGRKPVDDVVTPGEAPPRLHFASGRLAFSLLIACAAIVYFIVRVGG